jgi:hypothetical protein
MPVEVVESIQELPRDWPALRRLRWALWLNAVAPGTGLIALQRPMTGLVLAGGFLVSAETALLGLLVMPLSLGGLVTACAVVAAALWVTAQLLLMGRMNDLQDPQLRLHASTRIEQAREAVAAAQAAEADRPAVAERGSGTGTPVAGSAKPADIAAEAWSDAAELLTDAARYDDEQPDLNSLMARVCTAVSPGRRAIRQWRRLEQVDRSGRYEADIREALSRKAPHYRPELSADSYPRP